MNLYWTCLGSLMSILSLGRGWAAASTRCSQLATGVASCTPCREVAGLSAGVATGAGPPGASISSSRLASEVCIVLCILYQKRQDPILSVIPPYFAAPFRWDRQFHTTTSAASV